MTDSSAVVLLLALPLAGFLVTGLVGRRLGARAWIIAVPVVVVTWLIALVVIARALGGDYGNEGLRFALWRWIPAGALQVDINLAVDQLTAVLLFVVTTVGMLVHVYSIGYMAHDPSRWRFFAYLNLFMFSMLLLVLAGNFVLLFAGWELVGLSSYLLIGFWYRRRSAALAAKKAFIVNRVGDVGFALGIFAIWTTVGTLDIGPAVQRLADKAATGELAPWMVTGIALLLFAGAVGKSAQFPLHVWLPDAMEGPTPVSALIHAATMVNAGVYLVARTNRLFAASPDAMLIVAAIGIFTAILAASIAMTQTDIKRVLAYSTLSQLGYMFAALGRRGLGGGDLPPPRPGLHEGPAVPWIGLGHPRRRRRAGHAPDGRASAKDPDHLRHDADRLAGDGRHPAARAVLQQGRDPRLGLQDRLPLGVGGRLPRGGDDRVLHVPAHRPHLLGREPGRSQG